MKKRNEIDVNKELLRLALIAVLIAGMFGLLQYYPEDKVFDSVELGSLSFKIASKTFLYAAFSFFLVYLLFLGFNLRYEGKQRLLGIQALCYDLAIFVSAAVVAFTFSLVFLVWLMDKMQFSPIIVVLILWTYIGIAVGVFAIIFALSFRNYFNNDKKKKRRLN